MKKFIFSFVLILFFVLGIMFSYCTEHDEAIVFGSYCYYIENGNIYRAPLTVLSGETELFRENSIHIYLNGSDLVSVSAEGDIVYYSLISIDAPPLENIEYKASANDDLLLGSLSAKYESNGNPAAISKGNDAGGVSFGAYQFASNAGVPKAFSDWCVSSGASPEIGNRLLNAYQNDGSACGENFKSEWLAIAEEDPDFFLSVQHRYVKEKYYDAIVSRVEKNVQGFKMEYYGIALQNVFWSRSVQHGVSGSYNVITRAFDAIGGFAMQSEETLIKAIYAESGAVVDTGTNPMTGATAESLGIAGKYMKYYSKNSSAVQISVYKRLNINEPALALEMLEKYGGYKPPVGLDYEFADFASSEISENSATISAVFYNYTLKNISEYGFFMGKSLNSLIDYPLFTGSSSSYTLNLTKKFSDTLDSGTIYYYGAYAFVEGEYITSDIFTFETAKEIKFNVLYLDYNGTVLYETTVKNGGDALYLGKAPVRHSNAQFSYKFVGWDKDEKNITANTVLKAVYSDKDHLWNGDVSDSFSHGNGTVSSPYLISTAEELAYLSLMVNSGYNTENTCFALNGNIVLGYGNVTYIFTPIGTEENPFKGSFNGNGFKIIGLNVFNAEYAGLFGVIRGGRISSLIIENAQIDGVISGGLVGKVIGSDPCVIDNCSVGGNIKGVDFSGGIAGYCEGNATLNDVYFEGKITSKASGGILGYCSNAKVNRAFCKTDTSGEKNDAICALFTENAVFENCYYCDEDNSSVGVALNFEEMKAEAAYSNFDFINKWQIENDYAVLSITKENSFDYCKYGDTNGDGEINVVDVVFIAQYLAAWNLDLPHKFKMTADVNHDGIINVLDAIVLVQYLADWDVSLTKK